MQQKKYSKSLEKEIENKNYVVQPLYEGDGLSQLKTKTFSPLQKLNKLAEAIQRMHKENILH